MTANRCWRGTVSRAELLYGYRLALRRAVEPGLGCSSAGSAEEMAVEQATVEEHSDAVGNTIGQLSLPAGTVILSLRHAETSVAVTAETTVEAGDQLGVLVSVGQVVAFRRAFSTSKERSAVDKGRGLSGGGLI
ncbi:MAG: TrkA C-terminal domain-containing protein [Acidimicrobiales bacterium]